MYFCLRCCVFHKGDNIKGKIFATGYRLVEDQKMPLGICKSGEKDIQNNEERKR